MRVIAALIKSSLAVLFLLICASQSIRIEASKNQQNGQGENPEAKSRFEVRKDKDGFLDGRPHPLGNVLDRSHRRHSAH